MPPKAKITRDKLLDCAVEIAEKEGIGAVTSRSVAGLAGCSVQPVFSHFPTMDELRQATSRHARQQLINGILAVKRDERLFISASMKLIDTARNKPNIFRLIFLSGFCEISAVKGLKELESSSMILENMSERFGLDREKCRDILARVLLFIIGIGAVICEDNSALDDKTAESMIKRTAIEMIACAKGELP